FLDILSPWRDLEEPRPLTDVPAPLTASALVAGLRRRLEEAAGLADRSDGTPDAGTVEAAAALARLAEGGIRGAEPQDWWGLLPLSTEEPLVDATSQAIPVSPSRVETALKSPLNWFLYQAGSQPGSTQAQSIGTLIHAVAEAHPDGPP